MRKRHDQSPSGSRTTITSEWHGHHGPSHRQIRSGNAAPAGKRFTTLKSAQIRQGATAVSGNADRGLSKIRIMTIEIFTASERKTISFDRRLNSGDCLPRAIDSMTVRAWIGWRNANA